MRFKNPATAIWQPCLVVSDEVDDGLVAEQTFAVAVASFTQVIRAEFVRHPHGKSVLILACARPVTLL